MKSNSFRKIKRSIVAYLRTHFIKQGALREIEVDFDLSPHPSPHGDTQASKSTLADKELMSVSSSALPQTASVSPQAFTASASAHAPASANLGPRTTGSREK